MFCSPDRASGPPSPLLYITTDTVGSVHRPTTVSCTEVRRQLSARLQLLCRLLIIHNRFSINHNLISMIYNHSFFSFRTLLSKPWNTFLVLMG